MLAFIIILLFGLLVAFFAGQNTALASIKLYNYQLPTVPLYVVIVGSMVIGFLVSWLVSLIDVLSNKFTIQKKNNSIRFFQKKTDLLDSRIHDLEIENARLRGENKEQIVVEKPEEKDYRPHASLFGRFRHSIS